MKVLWLGSFTTLCYYIQYIDIRRCLDIIQVIYTESPQHTTNSSTRLDKDKDF